MASTVSPAETTGAVSSNGDTRASTASPVASMPPPPTTPPTSVCSDYAPSSPIMGMKIYLLLFYKMLRSLYLFEVGFCLEQTIYCQNNARFCSNEPKFSG